MGTKNSKKLARLTVRIPENQKERLAGTAARTNQTFSDVIRACIDASYVHGDAAADEMVRNLQIRENKTDLP